MIANILSLSQTHGNVALFIKGLCLITIYALYGLLQERIIKGTYVIFDTKSATKDNLTFTSAPTLVLCNRIISFLAGIALVQLRSSSASFQPSSPVSSPIGWETPSSLGTGSVRIAERISRFRPSSSLWTYAVVAALNNAATLSQYASLSYLSFTTATLGKSAKMVPVLILGALVYGKKYKVREWTGVAVVMTGIWCYLLSLPASESSREESTNWMGLATLFAYLLFDGLTSTTQERVFNKAKNDSAASFFGINAGVMDQMIWVNFFSAIVAFVMVCVSPQSSSLPSLSLLFNSPDLQFHVLMLSVTATFGLIMLFHVISCYGALVAGMIMTLRQFVSVVCNAVWFGNIGDISVIGFIGIGLVAAGVWIKMDRRYDAVRNNGVAEDATSTLLDEKLLTPTKTPSFPKLRQYLLPLIVYPILFIAIKYASILIESCLTPTTIPSITTTTPISTPSPPTKGTLLSESHHKWDDQILTTTNPSCPPGPLNSIRYNTTLRTAIATYPRSGSSYTRTLIERATGFQTSCIYCDKPFDDFFKAECDGYTNPWLIKTHFPSELKHAGDHSIHWATFDRYLQVVRNPIDIMWSVRNLMRSHNHSTKMSYRFSMKDKAELEPHLKDWLGFLDYWANVPIEGLVLRYEDIRASPFVNVLKMTSFLLPKEDLPSLDRVACAMTEDGEKEMYPSAKISPFRDWEKHFERDVFEWIIKGTEKWWCRLGYDRLLEAETGWRGPVDCMAGHQVERIAVEGMQGP